MTDRGLPGTDGSPACPFVAFVDDRDRRADRPDHRHRCFAEAEPAPRALAHQEAYCLSSAFPVCPVFQEWARREAAHETHVTDDTDGGAAVGAAGGAGETGGEAVDAPPLWGEEPDLEPERPHADRWGAASEEDPDAPLEPRPRRNPPRDWAAPPPWAGGAGGAGGAGASGARQRTGSGDGSDVAAEFLASRSTEGSGLAGSAADRLASGDAISRTDHEPTDRGIPRDAPARREPSDVHPPMPRIATYRDRSDSPAAPADPELAGLVGGGRMAPARSARPASDEPHDDGALPDRRPGRRPAVSSTRDRAARERDRAREVAERAGPGDGPAWERQRRFEAYPTIKTRAGLSGVTVPRIAVLLGALVVAAVVLFFLPALLGVGGRDPASSARPSVSAPPATASPAPTPIPEPTAQTYTIKSGDTLSRIARANGLTLDQLLEANKDTISNPNRIAVGDVIIIPLPPGDGEASPSP